jgi:hypothetical protein
LPLPETRVDYQDLSAYLEFTPFALPGSACSQPGTPARFSVFVEAPVRFLNPQVNADATGLGDMNAGCKFALFSTEDCWISFQFRTFIPTGNATKGLGDNHVTLEPALLVNDRVAPWLTLEGELRYLAPVGGTDFAGDIVRYGLGLSYGPHNADGWWLRPVTEFVGWTVLSGREAGFHPLTSPPVIRSAEGDTIVNAKLGARVGYGNRIDFYGGYGRALTGDVWYKDTWRVECRLRF